MDIRQAAVVAIAGVAIFFYLAYIGQFLASIAVMIILIIGMVILMTKLSKTFGDIPELTAKLSPNAKVSLSETRGTPVPSRFMSRSSHLILSMISQSYPQRKNTHIPLTA